ncbi:MAG: hypothetical protein WBP45_07910 [Daejeonella sp.]
MEKDKQPERVWQPLPELVREEIKKRIAALEGLSDTAVEKEIQGLNVFLDQHGLVGATVRLTVAYNPVISEERIEPDRIGLYPVFDRQLLTRNQFEGTFTGCSPYWDGQNDNLELAYTIFFNEGQKSYVVTVSHKDAVLMMESLQESEENDSNLEIANAFLLLSETNDPQYSHTVELLKKAYKQDNDDWAERLRLIGQCATKLISLPAHISNEDNIQALHALLMYCFEDELDYRVKSYATEDLFDEEAGVGMSRIEEDASTIVGHFAGVSYISNFDIQRDSYDNGYLVRRQGLQPAVHFEMNDGKIITYAMRQLIDVSEFYTAPDCQQFNDKMRLYNE